MHHVSTASRAENWSRSDWGRYADKTGTSLEVSGTWVPTQRTLSSVGERWALWLAAGQPLWSSTEDYKPGLAKD